MNLTLQRGQENSRSTPGKLAVDGVFECYTLEPLASGIPFPRIAAGGPWPITLRPSPKFQAIAQTDSWFKEYCDAMPHIEYKPDSVTMIHPLNAPDQTHDCIGVGEKNTGDWLTNSRVAFAALYQKILASDEVCVCTLEILDPPTQQAELNLQGDV